MTTSTAPPSSSNSCSKQLIITNNISRLTKKIYRSEGGAIVAGQVEVALLGVAPYNPLGAIRG